MTGALVHPDGDDNGGELVAEFWGSAWRPGSQGRADDSATSTSSQGQGAGEATAGKDRRAVASFVEGTGVSDGHLDGPDHVSGGAAPTGHGSPWEESQLRLMPAADGEDPKTLAEWSPPAAFDVQRFQKVLGEELRKLRRARGWTRKQLNAQISSEISLQTLGTYELGNRQCSVARLAELCVAMNELPQDLIARVHQRVFVDEPKQLRVDLRALAGAGDPRLVPLRRWAAGRLDQPQAREELLVEMAVVDQMADLCGLPPMELIVILHRLEG